MKKLHSMFEVGVLALLVGWLFVSAATVDIEYYDGYDSICNAGHFLGSVKQYALTRGPFFGLILVPAEWWKQRMDLHPLEVRPHHFTMAILHTIYLLGSYWMLIRLRGRSGATLLAFIAAVPTFIFFTYAPFISHDILPGVMFLAMLLLGERFTRSPDWRAAAGLILLGASAAMIKHTYALFWFFVLGIQFLLLFIDRSEEEGRGFKSLVLLMLCALASALIAAGTLGVVLKDTVADKGFFERVLAQVKYLTFDAHDQSMNPPWWVYLRNLPAYGLVAGFLLLPGLWMSWKEDRRMKGLVLAWVAAVVAMHLIGIRQVRYLIFIMPITAVLIVPVIQRIFVYREGLPALLAILLFNQFTRYSAVAEMARPFSDFYRESEARALLDQHPFPAPEENEGAMLIVNSHMLSFYDGRNTPLTGDVYHNLFHLDLHHIVDLYRVGEGLVGKLNVDDINRLEKWPENTSIIATSTGILINGVDWYSRPPKNAGLLTQTMYRSASSEIRRRSGMEYFTDDGRPLQIGPAKLNGQDVFLMQGEWLAPIAPHVITIRLNHPAVDAVVYGRIENPSQWLIPGFTHLPEDSSATLRYFLSTNAP